MADNQSGDFDISVENHEGSRLERRLASFDDKYNIFVSNKSFTSYLGSEELRSFKITDYIHPDLNHLRSLLKISLLRGAKKFSV